MTVFDFDDFHQTNHKLERLHELKELNPFFRCTAFAVPGLGTDEFWASIPRWIELAVHGWMHPDAYECLTWTRDQMESCIDTGVVRKHFVNGFKAPGWQISDACYEVLRERGWWVADQHLEDGRRPPELRVFFYEDGDNWHGHIQDWGSNGIDETWPELSRCVGETTEFRFASEAARLHPDPFDSVAGEDARGVLAVGRGADRASHRTSDLGGRGAEGLLVGDEPPGGVRTRRLAPPPCR